MLEKLANFYRNGYFEILAKNQHKGVKIHNSDAPFLTCLQLMVNWVIFDVRELVDKVSIYSMKGWFPLVGSALLLLVCFALCYSLFSTLSCSFQCKIILSLCSWIILIMMILKSHLFTRANDIWFSFDSITNYLKCFEINLVQVMLPSNTSYFLWIDAAQILVLCMQLVHYW